MRSSFFALMATALPRGRLQRAPQTSTPRQAGHDPGQAGSPRHGLGQDAHRAAAAAQRPRPRRSASRCSRPPKWRCSTPAPRNWRSPPTTAASTAEAAVEAYRKARTDGAALVLGPAVRHVGHGARAAGGAGRRQRRVLLQRRAAAQRGVWIMGIAAPPQVRRVVDHADRRRHQALRHLRAADALWRADGADARKPCRRARRHGGGGRTLRRQQLRSHDRRPGGSPPRPGQGRAASSPCWCRWRRPACRPCWPR